MTGSPSTAVMKSAQEQLFQLLKANKVKYVEIDCAEPSNKEARAAAWAISGKRAVYPQLFTRTAEGALTFIGDWEAVQTMNECNSDLHELDRVLEGMERTDGPAAQKMGKELERREAGAAVGGGGEEEEQQEESKEGGGEGEGEEGKEEGEEAVVEGGEGAEGGAGDAAVEGEGGGGGEGAVAVEGEGEGEGKTGEEATPGEVDLTPDATLLELLEHYGVEASEEITRDLMRWKHDLIA